MHRHHWFTTVLLFVIGWQLSPTPGAASWLAPKKQSDVAYHRFPVPKQVSYQAQFWRLIFSHYTGSHAVIHDPVLPNIVIDVIDFNAFADRFNDGQSFPYSQRRQIAERYIARYEKAISRLQREGRKAVRHGAMEKRIYNVYRNHPEGKKRLFSDPITLRYQTGLADEFRLAARRAQKYLPYMERIFRHHGVPAELTRIAFVESMFNEKAVSKVGASGIWQFMPTTARRFMLVNRYFDERNSPIKASTAAARLLAHNYKRLKTWPLAITAYNHGAGGMARAVRRVGTRDLGQIIRQYSHPSFGFASSNFYAEFLAAKSVYKRRHDHRFRHKHNPMSITHIKLPKPVSVHQLIRYTPLDESTLKRYNACLKPNVFERDRYRLLPRDYQIIVPKQLASRVQRALRHIIVSANRKRGYRS
jgi:membrane-bound lytic murein transglycosylase D